MKNLVGVDVVDPRNELVHEILNIACIYFDG